MVNFIFLVDIILQFVDRPRVAGVQLVDWCTRQPTRRAQKIRNCLGLHTWTNHVWEVFD